MLSLYFGRDVGRDKSIWRFCQCILTVAEKRDVAPYVVIRSFPKNVRNWWAVMKAMQGDWNIEMKDKDENWWAWQARHRPIGTNVFKVFGVEVKA